MPDVFFRTERRNTTQRIPSLELTPVIFDSLVSDTFSQLDANGRWICTMPGRYDINFSAYLGQLSGASNSIVIELYVQKATGNVSYRGQQFNEYPGASACLVGSMELTMNQGDIATVRVYSSGGAILEVFNTPVVVLQTFSARSITNSTQPFMAQEGVIDVTSAPYNAVGNGITDDTLALQAAISAGVSSKRAVFLPKKTFLISNTLFGKDTLGNWVSGITIVGEDRYETKIKLINNASNFQSTSSPKPMLISGSDGAAADGSGNRAFGNYLRNLTIDVGSNNPGAIALDWIASNYGAVTDVNLVCNSSNSGHTGLSMSRSDYGPFLIKNLYIEGFNKGVTLVGTEYSITCEGIFLKNQRGVGIELTGNILAISNLVSNNSAPAITANSSAHLVLTNSKLLGLTSAATIPAISTTSNAQVFLNNVISTGYQYLLNNTVLNGYIDQYSTDTIRGLTPTANIAFVTPVDAPVLREYSASDCFFFPRERDIYHDFVEPWDAAIASNKPVWCLPSGSHFRTYASSSRVIPPFVRLIKGNYSDVLVAKSGNTYFGNVNDPKPFFLVSEGNTNLFIENFFVPSFAGDSNFDHNGLHFLWNNSNRNVIITSVIGGRIVVNAPTSGNAGNMWITDASLPLSLNAPNKTYCKQLNPEIPIFLGDNIYNNGAELYVLGLKTEKEAIVYKGLNGAKASIIGGLVYPARPVDTANKMIDNSESSVGIVLTGSGYNSNSNQYYSLVKNVKNGNQTNVVRDNTVNNRTFAGFFLTYASV